MIPYFSPIKLTSTSLNEMFKDILDTRIYTKGKYSVELEERFCEIYDVDYAVSCGSGTQGLWLILKTLKPKTILCPSFEWKSVVPILSDYNVVWSDIDEDTWLLSDTEFSGDAIIFNQTFGNVGYINQDFKGNRIYDLAQSFGAKIDFSDSDIGVFSLAGTKNITSGEGGIIVTNNKQVYDDLIVYRNLVSRLSELQSALALRHLVVHKQIHKRKTNIFNYYKKHLPFKFQKIIYSHSFSVIGVYIENRNKVFNALKNVVETRIYYDPITSLPNTDKLFNHILCLPCYPDVNEKMVVKHILEVKNFD